MYAEDICHPKIQDKTKPYIWIKGRLDYRKTKMLNFPLKALLISGNLVPFDPDVGF